MYTKKNARVTFRSNRRSNYKRNNNYNNKNRNKGNVTQQYNKFLKLAKEASSSGDRIQAEYYYQFTDHFYRTMLELGIVIEENDLNENISSENNPSQEVNNAEDKSSEQNSESDKAIEDTDENLESIETIPFMSEPTKKKPTKSKKTLA